MRKDNIVGWFSSKPKETDFSRLLTSLETGQPVGDTLNFGGAEYLDASNYIEHDSSRRWAEKDFAHESQQFPVFVEFDTDSKYKNSIRIRYKSRHLGWIPKDDAKPLVKILNEHHLWKSIAGVGKISDLGRGGRGGDYGNVLLHITVFSKGNEGSEWKSPFRASSKKVKIPTEDQVKKEDALREIVSSRIYELAMGNWDTKKLSVGDVVCFSQFDNELREKLEQDAIARGFIVLSTITKRVNLLVIEGSSIADSAKAKKAIQYGIPVSDLISYLSENSDLI
jgi:hypothetical protein